VLKFRSVSNIVIAPANTGSDNSNRIVVIKIDHKNNGIRSNVREKDRIFIVVVIKLIAPKIDEMPARCKEKIVKSTDVFLWYMKFERGG
jgi:hypothetical protein